MANLLPSFLPHIRAKTLLDDNLDSGPKSRSLMGFTALDLHRGIRIAAQVSALVLICAAGQALVRSLNVPIPGYLLGMLLLFVLLVTGTFQVRWFEEGALLLLRHLSFFFIPIAVGLMAFGPFFQEHGVTIVVTLVTSAVVGILGTAVVAQVLSRKDPH
jgi:holin-like protein